MECVPGVREDVVKLACPLPSKATPLARIVAPSKKLTVPVGIPVAGATACTNAFRVTGCASEDGFELEVTSGVDCPCTMAKKYPGMPPTTFSSNPVLAPACPLSANA